MTSPKPYSQHKRIVRRYQVDVVRLVHRFPSLPEPHTSYQASVDMARGPEDEPDSTFAELVPTEEEAAQDALRIIAQRLLGREEVARLRQVVRRVDRAPGLLDIAEEDVDALVQALGRILR